MTLERRYEIEQLAITALWKHKIKENPGRFITKIVEAEGIELIDYNDWAVEECGRYLCCDDMTAIFYNAKHTGKMQAFTIAHELGHHFLGHLKDVPTETVCLDRDFQRMDESNDPKDNNEVEANFFAACLLLPLDQLKPEFDTFLKLSGRSAPIYVDRQSCNFQDYRDCIGRLSMYFFASETAIRYRLIDLGWMEFNITYRKDEDKGISIARYLEQQEQYGGFGNGG